MLGLTNLSGFGAGGYGSGTLQYNFAGSATSVTSGATLDCAFTGTAGRLLVALVAADNNGTDGAHSFAGLSLASGGTGASTPIQEAYDPGAAAAGAGLAVYTVLQTASGSNTATITFSPDTLAKAVLLYEVWHTGGAPVAPVAAVTSGGTGTTPSVTATSVQAADFLMGVIAVEARVVAGDAPGWSKGSDAIADTTVSGTSMALSSFPRIAATGGSYACDPILSVSRDYLVGIVTFRATP